jgi:hypothetical protein
MPDKPKDAVALLQDDHRLIEDLFGKYENAGSSERRRSVAQKICAELMIHMTIEEEILYPAVRGEIDDRTVDEAYVEHDAAKVLISDLMAGSPFDAFYDAKVVVLSEEVRHHVREEEKRGGGLFDQARASGIDLGKLGAHIEARRRELERQVRIEGVLSPMTRTLRSEVQHGSTAAW